MLDPFLLITQIDRCKSNINNLIYLYKIEFDINKELPIDYMECGYLRKLIREERVKFRLLKKSLSDILSMPG